MADTIGPPLVLTWLVLVCVFAAFWWGPVATVVGVTWLLVGGVLGILIYPAVAVALTVIAQWADAVAAWRARG